MSQQDRKWIVILLSMAFMILISGTFFPVFFRLLWPKSVPFVLYNTGSSIIFLVYFIIFAFLGAALGLFLNSYAGSIAKNMHGYTKKVMSKKRKSH